MKQEMSKEQLKAEQDYLAKLKAEYKPRLKSKSKNELIDIICLISLSLTAAKNKLEQLENKEESKKEEINEQAI